MKIEHKNIVIHPGNVEEFRKADFLANGEYVQKWDALGGINPAGDKVILYKYDISNDLKLSQSEKLYRLIKKSNAEQPYSLTHETQHAHNNAQFRFNQIDAICHTFVSTYLLDEISARTAANLYRIQQDKKHQHLYRNLANIGINEYSQALFMSIGLLTNEELCAKYCNIAANTFLYHISALINSGQKQRAVEIIKNQLPLYADSSKHQQFYTDKFYNTVKQYFVFDGIDINKKTDSTVQIAFDTEWLNISPMIFNISQGCLKHIMQNYL